MMTPAPVTGCTWIPLTQGRFALVNNVDADLAALSWYYTAQGYAARRMALEEGGEITLLHREVYARKAPAVPKVDHKNRDPLDCRRDNLRPADSHQNQCNRPRQTNNKSGLKGVFRCANHPTRWRSAIESRGKRRHLGYFDSAVDAALAYDRAAVELHGEYAFLNFVTNPFILALVRTSFLTRSAPFCNTLRFSVERALRLR